MSIKLNLDKIKVADQNGDWHGLNIATEEAVEEQIEKIESAGQAVIDSIPDNYVETLEDVAELKEDLAFHEGRIEALENSDGNLIAESDADADLDVSDSDGNVIMRLKDGHIMTKNFDSRNSTDVIAESNSEADLDMSDENGRVIVRFKNGHFETKSFDSSAYAKPHIITVKQDGGGDYTTLKDATESIIDASPTNPYVIEIHSGVYNALEGYSDVTIRSANSADGRNTFQGVFINDGVSLVGVGCRDDVVIYAELNPDDYPNTVRYNISTLNIAGNARLENLTVKCKYLRYCVHDDSPAPDANKQYQRIVRNCRFDIQRNRLATNDDGENAPNSYGAGMSGCGMNSIFEDCDFGTALGIHSVYALRMPTRHIIRNCRGYAFRPNDRGENVNSEFIVDNCNFDLLRYEHYQNAERQIFNIHGSGNDLTMVNANASDLITIGAITRHLNTMNLPVGTMVRRNGSTYEATTDKNVAVGVIVNVKNDYAYIQKRGFISVAVLGISDVSIGDYLTTNSNGKIVSGGNADNAVGIISNVDEFGLAHMKMMIGG